MTSSVFVSVLRLSSCSRTCLTPSLRQWRNLNFSGVTEWSSLSVGGRYNHHHWARRSEHSLSHLVCSSPNLLKNVDFRSKLLFSTKPNPAKSVPPEKAAGSKSDKKEEAGSNVTSDMEEYKKLTLFQKFKAMYRDYWYVLIPVHVSTSIMFFGAFYFAVSSGVDVAGLLEKLYVSEAIINRLRDSSAGYIALSYVLYKVFTPIRYTVTLGGTTWAIRFLTQRGMIKARPMKDAKRNMQNVITAMKMPRHERQKFLEEKGLPRIGKAVHAASSYSNKLKRRPRPKK